MNFGENLALLPFCTSRISQELICGCTQGAEMRNQHLVAGIIE